MTLLGPDTGKRRRRDPTAVAAAGDGKPHPGRRMT